VVNVAPMVNIEDMDLFAVLVDRVPDAVLASSCPPGPWLRGQPDFAQAGSGLA